MVGGDGVCGHHSLALGYQSTPISQAKQPRWIWLQLSLGNVRNQQPGLEKRSVLNKRIGCLGTYKVTLGFKLFQVNSSPAGHNLCSLNSLSLVSKASEFAAKLRSPP